MRSLALAFVLGIAAIPAWSQAQSPDRPMLLDASAIHSSAESTRPTPTFTVIHNFTGGEDLGNPVAGVVMDHTGNLYGTSLSIDYSRGIVFRISHLGSRWVFHGLYGFQGGSDGETPEGPLTIASDAVLYGTTVNGGGGGCNGYGCGTVYGVYTGGNIPANALGTSQWFETPLYDFTGGTDGMHPFTTLVVDAEGNLYGTTREGGIYGYGSVFELQDGSQYQLLYSFTGFTDGFYPKGLLLDSAGNLYGTVLNSFQTNIFRLSPSGGGWTEQTLHTFDCDHEACLPDALTMDQAGNLYGIVNPIDTCAPDCDRFVFMLSPAQGHWVFSIISYLDDMSYGASISAGADGNLYGSLSGLLPNGPGSVFKLSQSGGTWTYTDLHDFNGGDGLYPSGNIATDASGNAYGATEQGGAYGYGVVWQITP